MTDNDTPRVGDTVRVELTAVVREVRGINIITRDGVQYSPAEGDVITVIKRADSPENDPIGTVATLAGDVWVKYRANSWAPMDEDQTIFYNSEMTGRVVTGAVLGTPAAESKPTCSHTFTKEQLRGWLQEMEDNPPKLNLPGPEGPGLDYDVYPTVKARTIRNPRTIRYGDPEPDRYAAWRDTDGDVWSWRRSVECWRTGGHRAQWDELGRYLFPMIEVIEP